MKESKKSFLLRIDSEVLQAVQMWASNDLRSLNSQIEFLLRKAVRDSGLSPRELPIARAVAVPAGVQEMEVEEEEAVFRPDDL